MLQKQDRDRLFLDKSVTLQKLVNQLRIQNFELFETVLCGTNSIESFRSNLRLKSRNPSTKMYCRKDVLQLVTIRKIGYV